jgi:hypothetical protein
MKIKIVSIFRPFDKYLELSRLIRGHFRVNNRGEELARDFIDQFGICWIETRAKEVDDIS